MPWFRGLEWSAPVASWLEGVGALAAAAFALLALYQVAIIHRRSHEPFLKIADAWFERGSVPWAPDKWYLRAIVENLGSGMARDIRLLAWVRETPGPFGAENAPGIVAKFMAEIDLARPEFEVRLDAIRAGAALEVHNIGLREVPSFDVDATVLPPLLFYWTTFKDVFYANHPRRRRRRVILRQPQLPGHLRLGSNWKRVRDD